MKFGTIVRHVRYT